MKSFLDKLIYYGALSVVFLLPAYLARFKIFDIPTTLLELLIYGVFITFVLRLIFFGALCAPAEIFKDKLLLVGLGLFFGGALIASILSVDQRVSFGLLKAYFFDPLVFLAVIIFSFDFSKIPNILKSYLFSAFGVSILSFFYFLGGELTYDGRLQGIFNSPNYLAMYVAPAIIIAGWFVFYGTHKDRLSAWFYRFALSFLIFILYLTVSYGAFLGIILAVFPMLFFQTPNLNLTKSDFVRLGVAVIVIVFLLIFQWPTEKFQKLLSFSPKSSITQRIYIWEASLDIFKNNFLVGVGPGMFQNHYQLYKLKNPPSAGIIDWSVPYPHNVFLSFFVQNGLLGGIGFLLLIYWLARTTKEIFNSEQKKYAILLGAFLVYFLVHGMFDTLFWKNDLSLMFFMFLSIAIICKNPKSFLFH